MYCAAHAKVTTARAVIAQVGIHHSGGPWRGFPGPGGLAEATDPGPGRWAPPRFPASTRLHVSRACPCARACFTMPLVKPSLAPARRTQHTPARCAHACVRAPLEAGTEQRAAMAEEAAAGAALTKALAAVKGAALGKGRGG
jgi:hypothetical protein